MALELELEGWMGTYQVKREEEQRAYALQEEARGTGTAEGPEEWGSFANSYLQQKSWGWGENIL